MPQLTPQENFRFGFLLRCAEEGCSVDEIRDRVKLAADLIKNSTAKPWMDWMMSAGRGLAAVPLSVTAAGIAGGGLLGAAGGYGLAKMQNSDVDPDEAKRQELISAYQMQADLARRRAMQRSYRRLPPAAPKLF